MSVYQKTIKKIYTILFVCETLMHFELKLLLNTRDATFLTNVRFLIFLILIFKNLQFLLNDYGNNPVKQ